MNEFNVAALSQELLEVHAATRQKSVIDLTQFEGGVFRGSLELANLDSQTRQ